MYQANESPAFDPTMSKRPITVNCKIAIINKVFDPHHKGVELMPNFLSSSMSHNP